MESTTHLIRRLDNAIAFAEQEGLVRRAFAILGGYEEVCTDAPDSPGNDTRVRRPSASGSCEYVLDTDVYNTDERRTLQSFINDRLLVRSNLSSNPGPSATYRLEGQTICNVPENAQGSSPCVEAVNRSNWLIRVTRPEGGLTRYEVFVGEQRHRMGMVRVRSNQQTWVLNLSGARAGAETLESIYADVEGWSESRVETLWEVLPEDVSGRLRLTMRSSGAKQFSLELSLESVTLQGGGFDISIPTSKPLLGLSIDGAAPEASMELSWPALTLSFPLTLEQPSGPTEYDSNVRIPTSRLRASLDASNDRISVDTIRVGGGSMGWWTLDDARVIEFQRKGNQALSGTISVPDDSRATITFGTNWSYDTRYNFGRLEKRLDLEQWLVQGQILAEVAPQSEILWRRGTRAVLESGEIDVRDTRAGVSVQVRGGQCLVDEPSSESDLGYYHPLEGVRGGQCPDR